MQLFFFSLFLHASSIDINSPDENPETASNYFSIHSSGFNRTIFLFLCQNVTRSRFETACFLFFVLMTKILINGWWDSTCTKLMHVFHFIRFAELCLSVQLLLASTDRRCLSVSVKDVICIWTRLFYCLEAGTNHLARSHTGQFASHNYTESYSLQENVHVCFILFDLCLFLVCSYTVSKKDV